MTPIGHVDQISQFKIAGWAADEDRPGQSVSVVITRDGTEIGRVLADRMRPGLAARFPAATGRHGFLYAFNPPISPFTAQNLDVRVAGSAKPLPQGSVTFSPVESHAAADALRPGNAILLSTSGRSGSTVLMGILAQHPAIVVAAERPYEVEMLCYYSYALRVLLAAGDHDLSLPPERITAIENRFKIGFNPFLSEGFQRTFRNRALFDQFFRSSLSRNIGRAFRDVILDFYASVAADRGKVAPLYFAEKSLPEFEVRLGARHLFGRIKEIVLVRDTRDVVCSFINSAGTDFARTVEAVNSSAQRFVEIAEEGGPDIHFVRYEDLVLQPEATLTSLFDFLGLASRTHMNPSTMPELFNSHATSRSPAKSIGRWRRDLSEEQREACRPFASFLEKFGYDPTPPASSPASSIVDLATVRRARSSNDAAVPLNPRLLPLHELMLRFESLGENCEFGLAQRRCGVEPLGLLRFAGTPLPALLAALNRRFEGFGAASTIAVELGSDGQEYMIRDTVYGINYHAWAMSDEISPAALQAREARRLPFLVRKLLEDLTDASKIFVFHAQDSLSHQQAADLHAALRAYGPCQLLWVDLDDHLNPPGTVVEVAPGLLKGHINRFAPPNNAHDLSLDGWVDLCRAAVAMVDKHPQGRPEAISLEA